MVVIVYLVRHSWFVFLFFFFIYIVLLLPLIVVNKAVNGVDRSNGRTCSDAHRLKKNRCLTATTSRMRRQPFDPTDLFETAVALCMWGAVANDQQNPPRIPCGHYASIYYRFRDIAAYWSKIATPLYLAPPLGWSPRFQICSRTLGDEKLEWRSYRVVKEFWWCVQPFWHKARV